MSLSQTILNKIFFLFILLFVNIGMAQSIIPSDVLNVNSILHKSGLQQLNVKAMAIDDMGYLWVGTEDGLNRYNSYDFKQYSHNPNDSTTIDDDHIRNLFITQDTLWVATNTGGINGYIPSEDRFFEIPNASYNRDINTSYKIFCTDENKLLFSVNNNLIVFNRNTKEVSTIDLPIVKKENHVTDILKTDNETYWLATSEPGLLKLDINTLEIVKTSMFSDLSIQCFYKSGNNIFLGAKSGFYVYNEKTRHIEGTVISSSVKCFYNWNDSQLLIGTDQGLFTYNINEPEFKQLILKNQSNKVFKVIDINHIIGDKKGNLWIGTEGRGLIHYNSYQKKFNTLKLHIKEYPSIENISPFQFLNDKDSTIWIGSKYGIVKYFHLYNRFKFYRNTNGNLIYTIIRDKNNTIWAGGFTTGLLKYDEQTDAFEEIADTNGELPDKDVIEIIPIDNSTLLVCTWAGGIQKFNIKNKHFEEVLLNGKRINRARSSLVDSKGNIWIGTDQGVYKIDNTKEVYRYHKSDIKERKLSSNRVFSIKEDSLGNIWFGTSEGLTKLDILSNTTTLFYKQGGLPNDFIYSVLIDGISNIWVSTNFGISVLDSETLTFKNYMVDDGLQGNEFNGKAAYKDIFGNFYFGGISGINIFNPIDLIESPYSPKTYIESVDVFNEPILQNELFKDALEFNSNNNVITFNYSALNYLNPEKTDYSFKLEGFDDSWRPLTKDRNTTYTNLDPGSYIFKVKASNGYGKWNSNPDTLSIVIIPPWYKTTLFTGLILVFFLVSGPLIYYYNNEKMEKEKILLEQVIQERTREIKYKNNDLKKGNHEIKSQNIQINFLMKELSHRIKNNLQVISSLLNIQANSLDYGSGKEELMIAKNRILAISYIENIKNNSKDLRLDLLLKNLTANIISVLTDSEDLKFKVVYDISKSQISNLNTTMIALILNELVTNTVKHAFSTHHPDNTLSISCKVNNDLLSIIISDNGKGYSPKDINENSLGLDLITDMVNQLNGKIIVTLDNGTKNHIEIPIN